MQRAAIDDHVVPQIDERAGAPYNQKSPIPVGNDWPSLLKRDGDDLFVHYRRTLEKGLLKVLARMGISTVRSYHGAQLFEAVGIAPAVIARHFTGTPSLLGGVDLEEIARETLHRHAPGARRRATCRKAASTGIAARASGMPSSPAS